jgi:hypothetical protein
MKLHELVSLRNQLANALEFTALNNELEKNYSRLLNLTNEIDQDLSVNIHSLANEHLDIKNLFDFYIFLVGRKLH